MDMLRARREQIIEQHKGEIYSYKKYRTMQPKLTFTLENQVKKSDNQKEVLDIERKFQYNDKVVSSSEVEKHIRNKDTFLIIEGESGLGKTTFIESMSHNLELKYGDKLRIRHITSEILNDEALTKKKID